MGAQVCVPVAMLLDVCGALAKVVQQTARHQPSLACQCGCGAMVYPTAGPGAWVPHAVAVGCSTRSGEEATGTPVAGHGAGVPKADAVDCSAQAEEEAATTNGGEAAGTLDARGDATGHAAAGAGARKRKKGRRGQAAPGKLLAERHAGVL